ncbi:MAG: DNA-processing protein DprA [Nitrospirota bacterium]|nr:DNA-processing protein DprA [Nitrospirota bacterium]MDH4360240.1 DNA-processing protein DprA [Nitrospirota bacterium]MDH5295547.1 DNA-processing protein DprA [Nitrospirota bacterium]MDH5574357.1 DNA-processing protein DprA [Nitrospirota bacterium]
MTSSLQGWLELLAVKGLGPVTYTRLINRFGSPDAIRSSNLRALIEEGEISPSLAMALQQPLPSEAQEHISKELKAVQAGRFSILTLADPQYPARLKTITDPPPVLWCTGQLQNLDQQALAVVGSRNGSHIGRTFTRQLSGDLAALGFTIVSGLARGIDAAAHEGALGSSGRTLAVLGCGIDRLYPPEHGPLRQRIEQQGAVLSEFPMGTPPHSYHFPQRNRVISGLSLGVIVTEATSRSGSLITARMALEQNREIFAVPGNVTNPLTRGPHRLIKEGAKLVENPLDVVEEILPMLEPSFRDHLEKQQLALQSQPSAPSLGPEEQRLFACLSLEPVSLDDLISQGSYAPSEVMSILLSLEIKGLIKQIPGLQYLRMSIG